MPLKWTKVLIADERYESAGVFDVDGDGILDIVSGAWWYKGPDFKQRFPVAPCRAEGEYYDDFSTIAMDVDGDGRMDFITGGWWGNTLRWRQNPGKAGEQWQEHIIAEVVQRATSIFPDDLVLVVTAPPSLPATTALAALARGASYTILVQDSYPEILIAVGAARPGSFFVKFANLVNRAVYKHAARIIVMGRDMNELFVRKSAGLDILDNTACALFVDLRNSGHQDLVLVRTSQPLLLLNDGKGKFADETAARQCGCGMRHLRRV